MPLEDLDNFLTRFRAHGSLVENASVGMVDVVEASERVRWPAIDIIMLVVDGKLRRIELLSQDLKLLSVLVDPDEVRANLTKAHGSGRLTVVEAASRLRMETWAVQALISGVDPNGKPILPSHTALSSSGASKSFIGRSDLESFSDRHVDLKELSIERGFSARYLRKHLDEQGITPILPKSALNRFVYRRADL